MRPGNDTHPETGREAAFRAAFREAWRHRILPAPDDVEHTLRGKDPKLGVLIDDVIARSGARRFRVADGTPPFEALARAVVYQQLSMDASAAIYGRLASACGGILDPQHFLRVPEETLVSTGLSRSKIRCLQELAGVAVSGSLDLGGLRTLPDDTVLENLTAIRGIGPWTAQMFLMFHLCRPDILPAADSGVRQGFRVAYGLGKPADPEDVLRAGERWKPYRSIACLYLWAAVAP